MMLNEVQSMIIKELKKSLVVRAGRNNAFKQELFSNLKAALESVSVVNEIAQLPLKLSGQHEEILVIRANGQVARVDTIDLGFFLGLLPDISDLVNQAEVQLQPGDGIVLYTDGITEAENSAKEYYGLERLCQVVSENWQQSAEAVRQAVISDVRRHIGEQEVQDDMTLLVLKQQ